MKLSVVLIVLGALSLTTEARKHRLFGRKWEETAQSMQIHFPWSVKSNRSYELCIKFQDRIQFESENDKDSFVLNIQSEPENVFEPINTTVSSIMTKVCFEIDVVTDEKLSDFIIKAFVNLSSNGTESEIASEKTVNIKRKDKYKKIKSWHNKGSNWNRRNKAYERANNRYRNNVESSSSTVFSSPDMNLNMSMNAVLGKQFENHNKLMDKFFEWDSDESMNDFHQNFQANFREQMEKTRQMMESMNQIFKQKFNVENENSASKSQVAEETTMTPEPASS